jgi:sulfite exporter TauE/SafE
MGLFGGAHCAGMCGGIVTVLGARQRIIPILPAGSSPPAAAATGSLRQPLAYNAGRIASYSIAGALAGAVGSAAWFGVNVLPAQQYAFAGANIVMIVLGLVLLAGASRLVGLERIGALAWRPIAPTAARLLRVPGPRGALLAGLAWGWVPCGMVYGVLVAALVSGGATEGAALMLAFGLGTLPNLLALGWLVHRGASWLDRRALRIAAAIVVLGFGLTGLARLDPVAGIHQVIDACLQPWR